MGSYHDTIDLLLENWTNKTYIKTKKTYSIPVGFVH